MVRWVSMAVEPDLRPGVAHHLADGEAVEPDALVVAAGVLPEPVLGEREVAAERLRQVGVDGGQLDPELRQLGQGRTTTTQLGGHADGPEAGLLEAAYGVDGQLAVQLPLEGADTDLVEHRRPLGAQAPEQGGVVGRAADDGATLGTGLDGGHGWAPRLVGSAVAVLPGRPDLGRDDP